ncbi:MAG: hypothetical protein PXZ08_00965 [Actinomycetota bacterium]|nr:hypothetical protein [Actinomycetota bacterium]
MFEYARQGPRKTLKNILFALEHHPSRAISSCYDTLTRFQTSDSHRVDWNRHLVLLANPGATPPFLYFFHICKEYQFLTPSKHQKSAPYRPDSFRPTIENGTIPGQ